MGIQQVRRRDAICVRASQRQRRGRCDGRHDRDATYSTLVDPTLAVALLARCGLLLLPRVCLASTAAGVERGDSTEGLVTTERGKHGDGARRRAYEQAAARGIRGHARRRLRAKVAPERAGRRGGELGFRLPHVWVRGAGCKHLPRVVDDAAHQLVHQPERLRQPVKLGIRIDVVRRWRHAEVPPKLLVQHTTLAVTESHVDGFQFFVRHRQLQRAHTIQ